MTDSFPRQQARTRHFSLGAPRSFQISPDGATVAFLRSRGAADPVTCLWALDVATGEERLIADPAGLVGFGGEDDELEKARRERAREQAAGIVGFATDSDFAVAAFALAGRVYLADLTAPAAPGTASSASTAGTSGVRELPARTPAADPRPDSSGRLVAYCCEGARASSTPPPAKTGRWPIPTARRTSRSAWPSSSPPKKWGAPGATGGRPTGRRCWSRAST